MHVHSRLVFLTAFLLAMMGCSEDVGRPAAQVTVDQCLSDGDMALLLPPDAGALDAGAISDVGTVAKNCVIGPCLEISLSQDVEGTDACINECLDGTDYAGLSQGCRDCYIEGFWCGQAHCTVPCLGDDEALCESCLAEYCADRTYECVGYRPGG